MRQCDGAVPSCSRCATKGVICNYDVEPNVARSTSLRRRHDSLQEEVDELRRFHRTCSRTSRHQSYRIFRRIRIINDPSEVAKSFFATRADTSTPDVNVPASSTDKSSNVPSALPIRSNRKDVEAQLDQDSPTSAQQSSRPLTVAHRIVPGRIYIKALPIPEQQPL